MGYKRRELKSRNKIFNIERVHWAYGEYFKHSINGKYTIVFYLHISQLF